MLRLLSVTALVLLLALCVQATQPDHVLQKQILAKENDNEFASSSTSPLYVHLALTGNPSEMAVSWHTMAPTQYSSVQYGLHSGNYSFSVTLPSRNRTYYASAGYVHNVVVTGLKPSTRYYYVCGDPSGGYSQEFSFVSAVQTQNRTLNFVIYGDTSYPYDKASISQIRSLMKQTHVDFIYHVGDISYADSYPDSQYELLWNEWFQQIQPISANYPYMVCPGNHEHSCKEDGTGPCDNYAPGFTVYNYRFRMPGKESGSNTNMFFSFNYGNVHFVSISTETDYPNAPFDTQFGDQLSWLQNDLSNVRRDVTPWIVIVGHRPIYCSKTEYEKNGYPTHDAKHVQEAFEDIFYQHKVDLFITGHVHIYERMYPVYRGQRVATSYNKPSATVHIVSGAAGNVHGLTNPKHLAPELPQWDAHRYHDYGFGVMSVVDDHTLEWKFIRDSDGGVEDSFTITK